MSTALETIQATEVTITPTALESQTRAEIDVQIATANRYPRSLTKFTNEATGYVTLSPEIADGCIYALPRGGKELEGPSIRFAEVIASTWGNLRCAARIVSEDEKFITAQAIVHDLQTNVCVAEEVRRAIVGKDGRRYNNDMVIVTGMAAKSIALRNAILKVIPRSVWEPIYKKAEATITGGKDVETRLAAAFQFFLDKKVPEAKILNALSISSRAELNQNHLLTLIGWANSIKDNPGNLQDIFSEQKPTNSLEIIGLLRSEATIKYAKQVPAKQLEKMWDDSAQDETRLHELLHDFLTSNTNGK
jgi:hypothetical protein